MQPPPSQMTYGDGGTIGDFIGVKFPCAARAAFCGVKANFGVVGGVPRPHGRAPGVPLLVGVPNGFGEALRPSTRSALSSPSSSSRSSRIRLAWWLPLGSGDFGVQLAGTGLCGCICGDFGMPSVEEIGFVGGDSAALAGVGAISTPRNSAKAALGAANFFCGGVPGGSLAAGFCGSATAAATSAVATAGGNMSPPKMPPNEAGRAHWAMWSSHLASCGGACKPGGGSRQGPGEE
mmetsp:Transcript_84503/g.244019  ORF Transcript_84503/g.244019 Transcript_84503/m.244019 type:complete len:235 (-) Transcript_84503:614-1318(-)